MSKSYKVAKKTINMGEKKGQTLFSVRPYSYGTLTTEEVANQIAVESTATPADVKAVLDRYAYYVKENLEGLRHRVAWIRQALHPLHYRQSRRR